MSNMYEQVSQWVMSSKRLVLTDDHKKNFGEKYALAKDFSQCTQAYTFRYDVEGSAIAGFVVAPKKIDTALPVIIYNRGGCEDFGVVDDVTILTHVTFIASHGYIVVGSQLPGNRLSEGKDERGGESDQMSILRLYDLITHLTHADESRIGMYGYSRGGMMTFLCMKRVNWIKRALTVGAVTNLDTTLAFRPEFADIYEKCHGNTEQQRNARSVVKWVSELPQSTPICILHGADDDKVQAAEALELTAQLDDQKRPYELHIYGGGDHTLSTHRGERNAKVLSWFSLL